MVRRICLSREVGEGIIVTALVFRAALWLSKKREDRLTLNVFDGREVRVINFRIGEEISVFEHFTLQVEQAPCELRWAMKAPDAYRIVRAEKFSEESTVA